MLLKIYCSGGLSMDKSSGRNGRLVQGERSRRGPAAVSLVASGGDIRVAAQASLQWERRSSSREPIRLRGSLSSGAGSPKWPPLFRMWFALRDDLLRRVGRVRTLYVRCAALSTQSRRCERSAAEEGGDADGPHDRRRYVSPRDVLAAVSRPHRLAEPAQGWYGGATPHPQRGTGACSVTSWAPDRELCIASRVPHST
jgi:hypothetical protein